MYSHHPICSSVISCYTHLLLALCPRFIRSHLFPLLFASLSSHSSALDTSLSINFLSLSVCLIHTVCFTVVLAHFLGDVPVTYFCLFVHTLWVVRGPYCLHFVHTPASTFYMTRCGSQMHSGNMETHTHTHTNQPLMTTGRLTHTILSC